MADFTRKKQSAPQYKIRAHRLQAIWLVQNCNRSITAREKPFPLAQKPIYIYKRNSLSPKSPTAPRKAKSPPFLPSVFVVASVSINSIYMHVRKEKVYK